MLNKEVMRILGSGKSEKTLEFIITNLTPIKKDKVLLIQMLSTPTLHSEGTIIL